LEDSLLWGIFLPATKKKRERKTNPNEGATIPKKDATLHFVGN
jgi:hypothetical protein